MLFETLDRIKRNAVMATIVLMFAGWALLVTPEAYIPFVGGGVAFALAVYALVKVFDFIAGDKALIDCIRLSIGLLAGIVGVMLFAFDGLFEQALSWLVGTVPMLIGLYGVYHAFVHARPSGRRGWWVLVVLSGLLVAFGTIVFWNPWMDGAKAQMQVVGGTVMYSAIVSALSLIWIWPMRGTEAS